MGILGLKSSKGKIFTRCALWLGGWLISQQSEGLPSCRS